VLDLSVLLAWVAMRASLNSPGTVPVLLVEVQLDRADYGIVFRIEQLA